MKLLGKSIINVLDKSADSDEFATLISVTNVNPLIEGLDYAFTSYSFYKLGFVLGENRKSRNFFVVDFIFKPFGDFESFTADLPFALESCDQQPDIVKKLGEPIRRNKLRRSVPVPLNVPKQEWDAFMEIQTGQPFTTEQLSFTIDGHNIDIWFDDDCGGSMTSIKVMAISQVDK